MHSSLSTKFHGRGWSRENPMDTFSFSGLRKTSLYTPSADGHRWLLRLEFGFVQHLFFPIPFVPHFSSPRTHHRFEFGPRRYRVSVFGPDHYRFGLLILLMAAWDWLIKHHTPNSFSWLATTRKCFVIYHVRMRYVLAFFGHHYRTCWHFWTRPRLVRSFDVVNGYCLIGIN